MIDTLLTFECRPCARRFEAAGILEQWTSVVYGPCREYHADCPACGQPAKEYRPKSDAHSHFSDNAQAPCGQEGGCDGGGCGAGPCGMPG